MIQKSSTFIPHNKCGVWKSRVFHTYTKLRRWAVCGSFSKVSIRAVHPSSAIKVKAKLRVFYSRSCYKTSHYNGISINFTSNGGLILKKRLAPLGRNVFGPAASIINRKKALASYICRI